jgi:hypothetical protein
VHELLALEKDLLDSLTNTFPHRHLLCNSPLPQRQIKVFHAKPTLEGVAPSLITVIGSVPRAEAPPVDAHSVAQDRRKEAAIASPSRRLPNPERPLVRIPIAPSLF